MSNTRGSNASNNGKKAENNLLDIITKSFGCKVFNYKDWDGRCNTLIKNFPYKTIYGNKGRSEFCYVDKDGERTRIEMKWQNVAGSVQEKFPYLLANMFHTEEKNVVIVSDGGGATEGSIKWLVDTAYKLSDESKSILVLTSINDFSDWCCNYYKQDKTTELTTPICSV
jgi:hypothetical protein